MTPSETARAALQKALEALKEVPKLPEPIKHTILGVTETLWERHQLLEFARQMREPASSAIEQALAALPAEEPPTASMDEKALEIARRLVSEGVPRIQCGIVEGMQWMRSQETELASAVLDLNAGWNAKEPERLIADRIDLARRFAKRVLGK